jgi:hypothetical protein
MSDDPWNALVDQQITNPRKAILRATATRAERRAAQAQSDQAILKAQWREWHDRRVKQLMTGKHSKHVRTLAAFLKKMTLDDVNSYVLVDLVDAGPWRRADEITRYLVLSLIEARIIYLRETEGWCPINDAIPFSRDEPTLFEIIRKRLTKGD